MNGRFNALAPTFGSSPGYVWNDANGDGVFAGSEQTRFGMAAAYTRLALVGSYAPVPEPRTYAFCALGFAGLCVVTLRRRRIGV